MIKVDGSKFRFKIKINVVLECSEPTTTQQCSEPTTTQQCSELTTTQQCSEPTTIQQCSEPTTTKQCSEPTTTQQCSKPTTTQQCSEPTTTQQCSEPTTTQQCSEPTTTHQCSKPTTIQQCSELTTTQQCSEPTTTKQYSEPTTTQQCSELTTTQQCPDLSTTQQCSELVFSDLCVQIKSTEILKDVSGSARSGAMLAVMGPSGSGKTTLLHSLAGKVNIISGDITLNGSPFNKQQRRRLGYVMQDDVFLSNLTLWETLYFTAMVRVSDRIPKQEKLDQIQKIVTALKLQHCLNTVIGDIFQRGLSGGERKRTHIACELLTDPDIFLVDEPTSGLDSSTAHSLMVQLKNYATEYNKTIVVTIHQPSSKIFHMFSSLLLLVEGQSVYCGPAPSAIPHFTCLGFPYNSRFNPADYLLGLLDSDELTINTIKTRSKELSNAQTVPIGYPQHQCQDNSTASRSDTDKTTGAFVLALEERETARWLTSSWNQLKMLNWRSYKQAKGRIFQKYDVIHAILLAVIFGMVYFQIENSEKTLRDKMGLVCISLLHWEFQITVSTILSYSADRDVVWKERTVGAYSLSIFYLSKLTSELPLLLVIPTLFNTAVYWTAGLGGVVGYFVYCSIGILNCLLIQGVASCIGIWFLDIKLGFRLMDVCILGGTLIGKC
ncbi:ABC transporter G family member 14-like [Mizuhopecten yessoensis]|uniref:ABC transporter G family member 14-like n=1 Tax=Mizuhopecten yessoensis TaxID=6573 RepID=UPI000B45C079|nr:ABC transporter G family member 14-like [Mizuhopecten yessoensis]